MKIPMGAFLFAMIFVILPGKTEIQARADGGTKRLSAVYDAAELIPEPEAEVSSPDGTRYELRECIIEEIPVSGRTRTVKEERIYTGLGAGTGIPERIGATLSDAAGGGTVNCELFLFAKEFYDERWTDDFAFTVTFHTYGAERYLLGELEIQGGGEEPALRGHEAELLELVGLEEENFRIGGYRWSGGAYRDADGVLCRDAEVYGSQRVSDCRAVYRNTVPLPDLVRYRSRSVYDKIIEEPAVETAASSSGIPEPQTGSGSETGRNAWNQLFKIIKTCFTVSVGLAGILALLLGLWFLLKLARKLAREKRGK